MGVAVQCDGCGKIEPTTVSQRKPSGQQVPLDLPAGWDTVSFGQRHGIACSHDCGAQWVLELGELAAEATSGDPEEPPHEWEPGTWAAFCRHHGVPQVEALKHAQQEASAAGVNVHRWTSLAEFPDIAENTRRFVLARSTVVSSQAAS